MRSKMQKRWTALVAVMLLLLVVAPLSGVDFRRVSAAGDFTVTDTGVLTEYTGSGGQVTIPSGVKRIHTGAFHSNTKITGVTFPSTLTEIDPYAFRGCTGLTSVALPSSLITIGAHAFYECSNLTSVKLNAGTTGIGIGAFEGCTALKTVTLPDGLTTIGNRAFRGTSSLNSVTLPSSLQYIYDNAFEKSGLTAVTLPASVVLKECESAFQNCASLKSVTFMGKAGEGIAKGMCKGCTALTGIRIPDGMTYIGVSAFEGCTSLSSVGIPDSVITISASAFEGCTALTSIQIPDGITYIGSSAFAKTSLTSATLSDNV